jgi:Fe-Mn family superoxide dismutase
MSSQALVETNTPAAAAPLPKRVFDLSRVRGLSQRTLDTHIGLYETYVKQANTLLEQLHDFPHPQELPPPDRLRRDGLVRRLAFEFNGVKLHELFFEALGSGGADAGKPGAAEAAKQGRFADAAARSFGSVEAWKRDVIEIGQTRGVGWVATVAAGEGRLFNVWIEEHSHGLLAGAGPIAVFDLWEHAFLFDFKPSQRSPYLEVLFDNLNWGVLESRCA